MGADLPTEVTTPVEAPPAIDILAELRLDNPSRKLIELQIYADALTSYNEAAANIREHGTIVMHPRTGSPIDNPYLRIRAATGAVLAKMKTIKSDRVMTLLAEKG